ncbi:FecR domain-containing protein [Neorhizobium petrolearium]|uniref:FecR domain-containing protein n=1 Tax=Neorhizobium petrolearium TaxID=515361 RepID=UPI003F5CF356
MLGTVDRFCAVAAALAVLAGQVPLPASAEPVPRSGPLAGAVIARKTGEEVRFIDVSDWRFVDLKQDLLTGDVLRTNATGQLAVLFSDRTQVRLGRNSSLVVKQITSATSTDTILQLQSGTIWARAKRGGPGVQVETPAAAAAIRGTDWTMTINGDQTSITVLEGVVEFSNPKGRLQVAEGEGAVATIGQAPRKVVIVDSDDREQMLFYLAPRGAFNFMPASPLPVADMRRQVDRIVAIPPARRTSEDLMVLAEAQLSLDGREAAQATLRLLAGRPLSGSQHARVEMINAINAAAEKRYEEAARMFAAATPRLDPARRSVAAYGAYYARSLADPNRAEQSPAAVGGPYSALLKAYAAGFLKDISDAIRVIREAERKYPQDPSLPAYRAQLAILINDRPQVEEAISRSLTLDPNEPTALEARANYRADFKGDLDGALADLQAALKIAPGSTSMWNALGIVQGERGDDRAAEEAFRKSIALDPLDPVSYSNLANRYLNQNRMREAKVLIDRALEVDPTFDLALIDRGRYRMQTGELDQAVDDMLAGTVANPGYSHGQTLLAAAYYEKGDRLPAAQALDNADRLDDNDPAISAFRTAVAIDEYDAEAAMKYARQYLERSRARGGYYASLGASQDAGSTLNNAFRLQGLDTWGQYYGDVVFDPFSGTSYIDQTIRGSVNPFVNSFRYGGDSINNTINNTSFSSLLQGLLFEPHMISGRSRSANLAQRPFLEGAIGGGLTATEADTGWIGTAEIQGFANQPVPMSAFATFSWEKIDDTTRRAIDLGSLFDLYDEQEMLSGTGYLTASPTPDDRFVAYVNHGKNINELSFIIPPLTTPYDVTNTFTTAGVGWSHTVGYRNVVNAALFYTSLDVDVADGLSIPLPFFLTETHTRHRSYVAAVNHTVSVDSFDWRYGVEGGVIETSLEQVVSFAGIPFPRVSASDAMDYGRLYVDLLHEITSDLKAEYALHAVLFKSDNIDVTRLEPRAGIAWTPVEGHWLRAGYIRQGTDLSTPTLSPIGLLGIQPNEFGVGVEGYSDTIALRWDAEWNDRLFTAVEYQHQQLHDLSVADIVSQSSYDYDWADVDRVSVTANVALGYGFGLSGTYAYAQSEHNFSSTPGIGEDLPFLPQHSGQIALTWVNPANVKARLAANYIGERQGDASSQVLDDYWTLDASLTWEPFDKRIEFAAAAYNLLDEEFLVSPRVNGWGRVFKGTLKVRF